MATATPTHTAPELHESGHAVPAHTRSQVLGLSLIAGAPLVTVGIAVLVGLPLADAAFLLPFIAAAALGAVAAWRWGTGGRVAGLVLGLGVAGMTFWQAFGLFEPSSAVEFTTGTAWVVGVVLLLWGGIGALVRRSETATVVAASEQRLNRGAVALVVLAALVSTPMWLVNRTTVDDAAAAGLVEVAAANFHFDDATAAAGTTIVVRNEDPFLHTFTIDDLGIDVELLPGSASLVELPDTTGTYTFYCIPHSYEAGEGEEDMAGTLTLE